ncbi:MAG TPA: histidine phosphatase family protein [Bryobacteraceae bacterium]|nr:histidine phosphatase family protein [Bryobacteraceae bacterium]
MTTFLLIRHGMTDAIGKTITGRHPGVHLNEIGRKQADELPARLRRWKIDAIYSSPLERALETAAPVSAQLRLPLMKSEALSEVDFGEWSGKTLDELNQLPEWRLYNTFRSSTRAPGGEVATEVQTRMVEQLTRYSRQHPEKTVAIFSHADAIRLTLAHFFGLPIDLMHRIEVRPASISVVRLAEWGPQVLSLNWTQG